MDLKDIKLVVTDMDGTLLNSSGEVSDRFFELFEKLQKHDVHFSAASGRQYHSISEKLEPIQKEISIIAENGGMAKYKGEVLVFNALNIDIVKELIPVLRKIKNASIVLCGEKGAYIEENDPHFIDMFKEFYPEYFYMEDLVKIEDDDIFKVALYHDVDSEIHIYPAVKHLEDELQIKVSGRHWVDIAHDDANKGNAVKALQKKLEISKKQTMAFGDYNNDLEMLEQALYSFAMENAHPNVIKKARYVTASNDDEGVEEILQKLVDAKENKD